MSDLIERIETRLSEYLKRRRHSRMIARFGGLQWCPWCKQCAQDGDGWRFDLYPETPVHDVLTCGVCKGTSLWHFAIGMIFIKALDPPPQNEEKLGNRPENTPA